MNKRGKSYILLDLIIVILLGLVIYSFLLPSQWIRNDLKATSAAEKALSTIQVGIDMYKTKYDGMLPGKQGQGIDAIYSVIDGIAQSKVLDFANVNYDELRNAFDTNIKLTKFSVNGVNYEMVVFAKDRSPHKYVMNAEKITVVDPMKKIIKYQGEVEGYKKDIESYVAKFNLYKKYADRIEDNLKAIASKENELKIIDDVYKKFAKAKSLDEINSTDYNNAMELLKFLQIKMDEIDTVKKGPQKVLNDIGSIVGIKLDDLKTSVLELKSYVKLKDIKKLIEKVLGELKETDAYGNKVYAQLQPLQKKFAEQVDKHKDELEKYNTELLEYKSKMQMVAQKFADLKKAYVEEQKKAAKKNKKK